MQRHRFKLQQKFSDQLNSVILRHHPAQPTSGTLEGPQQVHARTAAKSNFPDDVKCRRVNAPLMPLPQTAQITLPIFRRFRITERSKQRHIQEAPKAEAIPAWPQGNQWRP
jgi:hypothetical protein